MMPRPLLLAIALLAAAAPPAAAHEAEPVSAREFVRLQGYLAPPPAGVTTHGEMALTVLGQPVRFAVAEWQRFAVQADLTADDRPTQGTLQGERALLRRVSAAKPGQRITILAERRAGRTDLFVVAVDRCPPE
jgi:hypothetical protein